jgi:hypothetical protein
MGFVPVDINAIKMDTSTPGVTPQSALSGFKPVDINAIKMDAPPPVKAPESTQTPEAPGMVAARDAREQGIAADVAAGKESEVQGLARIALSHSGGRINDMGSAALEKIGNAVSPVAKYLAPAIVRQGLGMMADTAGEGAKKLYAALPDEKAKEMAMDALGLLGVKPAIGAVAKVAAPVRDIVKGATTRSLAKDINPETKLHPVSQSLHDNASGIIERAKNSGAKFTPNLETDLAAIQDMKSFSTPGDVALVPKTKEIVDKLIASVSPKDIKTKAGIETRPGDTSLRNLLQFRKALDSTVGLGGDEAIAAKAASSHIDAVIEKALTKNEITAPDMRSVENLLSFKKEWARYQQHKTLATAVERSGGDYGALKKEMQGIKKSPYYSSYPSDAKQWIQKIAEGTKTGDVLSAVGSLKRVLINKGKWGLIAGATGAGIGTVLTPGAVVPVLSAAATSAAADAAANSMVRGYMSKAAKAIEGKSTKTAAPIKTSGTRKILIGTGATGNQNK